MKSAKGPGHRRRPLALLIAAGLAIGTTVATVETTPPPASATYKNSLCSGLPTWPLASYNYNSTWMTPLNAARTTWNNHSRLSIYTSSSTANSLTVGSYSPDWYGYYTYYTSGKRTIQLNSRRINADASNWTNFTRSVAAHELGHSFCLDDDPNTSSSSLMKGSRNRNTLYSPTSYDWADINNHF